MTPLKRKYMRLCKGWQLAIQHSNFPVVVQSDSVNALAILAGDTLSRSAYGHSSAGIRENMAVGEFVPLMMISREQNRVAHQLAFYSRTEACTCCLEIVILLLRKKALFHPEKKEERKNKQKRHQ
uniref:RNase H type-1 domain-containing protein n=1 Tax=Aegilops tauschii subsp. strangulata TaxID=200361 RepID=A0A452XM36_AEGTS